MKDALTPGYLKQPDRRFKKVSLMDLLTLILNIQKGAATKEVGFVDANETLQSLTKQLNKAAWVEQSVLESGLYSCSMMNEQGLFEDIKNRPFQTYLKDVLGPGVAFDSFFHLIKDKK